MFLFARLCGNWVGNWGWGQKVRLRGGDGDDTRGNEAGMETEYSKRCGNGLGVGTKIYFSGR